MTLDEINLLWLAGRAARRKKRSLSDALDEVLTQARKGGVGADAPRSVVGTIDIAGDDPELAGADAALEGLFVESLTRPVRARETQPSAAAPTSSRRRPRG